MVMVCALLIAFLFYYMYVLAIYMGKQPELSPQTF